MPEIERERAQPPSAVLLDTNVWVYTTHLLRTPVARAFLHVLRHHDGRILLPEVYEMEIVRHSLKLGAEALENARKSIRVLRGLTGQSVQSPPSVDFERAVRERLDELRALLQRIPLNEGHARNALGRVMDGRPPSLHKKQEFKDSAAWEGLLGLTDVSRVAVISEDRDFSEDRGPSPRLASALADEASSVGIEARLYPSIASYLSEFGEHVPTVAVDVLATALEPHTDPELTRYAEARGLEVIQKQGLDITPFLTEREGVLSIQFRLTYEARPKEESDVYPELFHVRAEGQCTFDTESQEASEVVLDRLVPLSLEGEELRGKAVFMRATLGAIQVGTGFGSPAKERIPLDGFWKREEGFV